MVLGISEMRRNFLSGHNQTNKANEKTSRSAREEAARLTKPLLEAEQPFRFMCRITSQSVNDEIIISEVYS